MDEVYETIVLRHLVNHYNEIAKLMHTEMPDDKREEAMKDADYRYCTAILHDTGVIVVDP